MGSWLCKRDDTTIMSNSKLVVEGGKSLKGKIKISGAKNAVLPIMAASILTNETVTLENVPHLSDVESMISLLKAHGVAVDQSEWNNHILKITARNISTTESPEEISKQMRASVLVLGPLLARCGEAEILHPGGCKIGKRPIDLHLEGLRKLGAHISEKNGMIEAEVGRVGLQGSKIDLGLPSVGATENILMAACLAKGVTTIQNAAKEPEVCDLAEFLTKMGAKISGAGTSTITVHGVPKLRKTSHDIIADRIEAGTYAIAACAARGKLELEGISPDIMEPTLGFLERAGAHVVRKQKSVVVSMENKTARINPVSVETEPYPGFPTDMQSQWLSLMCLAKGECTVTENLFENRFKHVDELRRMGASIRFVRGRSAVKINGVRSLNGAEVWATDLRASASLLIAALSANGRTVINDIHHLERGYEDVVEKLTACGARMFRIEEHQ